MFLKGFLRILCALYGYKRVKKQSLKQEQDISNFRDGRACIIMAIKDKLIQSFILLMIALAAIARFIAYGDPRLAVATHDTISYVTSSEAPLLSKEFFTGQRLPTTNLLYKLFRPPDGYDSFVAANTTERRILPGYEGIALLQVLLSMLGWGALAFVVSSSIKNTLLKYIVCGAILLIGFTPHTVDWDSVMGSESLSFSLFMLAFALLTTFVFRVHADRMQGAGFSVVGGAFCVVFMLWAYTRDTNNIPAIFTTAMFGALLLLRKYREQKVLRRMTIFLGLVSLAGIASAMGSTRAATPMKNVYDVHILPYASRIDFMKSIGMPEPFSPEYHKWANTDASMAYLVFLGTHPRYTAASYFRGAQAAFVTYVQPYFRTPDVEWRLDLLPVGELIHVGFETFIIDIILILSFWIMAVQGGNKPAEPWIWLATWLFLTAAGTLFFGVVGDNIGLQRHTLFPVTAFRLFFWIFIIVVLDLLLLKGQAAPPREEKSSGMDV